MLRFWDRRYEHLQRRVDKRLRRVERERKELGRALHALNWHLIQALPDDQRADWEGRRAVMQEYLDPVLDRVESQTGWRFPYGAENDNAHRYSEHRYGEEPKGIDWLV